MLASHSGARALGDHPRNLTDRQLRAIARAGGVVQVVFVPEFIRPVPRDLEGDLLHNELWSRVKAHYASVPVGADPARDAALEEEHQDLCRRHPQHRVSVADVADHIDQVARVAGIDHVGIGSDFDGGARMDRLPGRFGASGAHGGAGAAGLHRGGPGPDLGREPAAGVRGGAGPGPQPGVTVHGPVTL